LKGVNEWVGMQTSEVLWTGKQSKMISVIDHQAWQDGE
jgi:hypothetical protein